MEALPPRDILEMYRLKTSSAMQAALVPLMMLVDQPAAETDLVRAYAEAQRLLRIHLAEASACRDQLPFRADLLKDMVRRFATRRR